MTLSLGNTMNIISPIICTTSCVFQTIQYFIVYLKYFDQPPKILTRIVGNHEQSWAEACKGGEPACSNFDYSGLLTETVVMGNLAIKYPNRKLKWDGENMKVTNFPEANDFVRMNYRAGWEI